MATVTGTLTDCGLGHLTGKAPQLVFTLSGSATDGSNLYATDPITVTPGTDGTWSISLAPTETMQQSRYYTLSVRWLDAAGNFIKVDVPDWQIFVPTAGGTITDITQNYTSNPLMVIYQATQPDPWPIGFVWLDTSVDTSTSGDLKRRTA